jgi:hypothetical protein
LSTPFFGGLLVLGWLLDVHLRAPPTGDPSAARTVGKRDAVSV